MIFRSLLFCSICVFLKADEYLNNCPVSESTNGLQTLFTYPIEFFDKKKNLKLSSQTTHYNCMLLEYFKPIRTCLYDSSFCPIDNYDLELFRSKTTGRTYYHSICKALDKDNLSKKQVIILGGSVTGGRSALWCHCDSNLNMNCPNDNLDNLTNQQDQNICRWGGRIENWFKRNYQNVDVYVITEGGMTSPIMAENLEFKLKSDRVSMLTSNDIIFIDHSVNDGGSYYTRETQDELIDGLDKLIRKIYELSTPGSWPTIILLEMYPYVDWRKAIEYRPEKLSTEEKNSSYTVAYERIANGYNIILWSYREIVWSKHFERQYDPYTVSLLRFLEDKDNYHPPWPVHLYYSELIADSLLYELQLCAEGNTKHVYDTQNMNMEKLRPSLAVHQIVDCDENIKPLLDLSATSFYPPANDKSSPKIGRFVTSPPDAFRVYEDRANKTGWIDEIDINGDKWYVLNYKSNITFIFDIKNNVFYNKNHILKIHYFKTYLNGGISNVFICNTQLATLDTLWPEELNYHVSETKLFSMVIQSKHLSHCNGLNVGSLVIQHLFTKDNDMKTREKQKVKIVKVKICQEKEN